MKKILIVAICLLSFSEGAEAQLSKYTFVENTSKFDEIVQQNIKGDEPGFSIAVIKEGKIIYSKSSGMANMEQKAPINLHTPFNIASISKTFTAAAILKLREEGKLKLDHKARKYLLELPTVADDIRIYHLLTHTSGLPDYERDMDFAGTNEAVFRAILDADSLQFEPHTDYSYSNSAYVLLAKIIEQVSGKKYEQFLDETFFVPLDMTNTFVAGNERMNSDNRAIGYRFEEESQRYVLDDSGEDYVYGSTGIYSSVSDLVKWYMALKEHSVLSSSSINLMYDYPTTISGKFSWMAMGWFNETIGRHTPELVGLKKRGAIGVTFGFRGILEMYENHDFGYIMLSNRGELPRIIGPNLAKIYFK